MYFIKKERERETCKVIFYTFLFDRYLENFILKLISNNYIKAKLHLELNILSFQKPKSCLVPLFKKLLKIRIEFELY